MSIYSRFRTLLFHFSQMAGRGDQAVRGAAVTVATAPEALSVCQRLYQNPPGHYSSSASDDTTLKPIH